HQQVGFAVIQQLLGLFQRNWIGWFQVAAGTYKGHGGILAIVMDRFTSVHRLTEWFIEADAHTFPFECTQKTKANGGQAGIERGRGYEKTFCHDCSRFHPSECSVPAVARRAASRAITNSSFVGMTSTG